MAVCDKCGAGILKDSNFCPQCGDPVTEEDLQSAPILEDHVVMAELSFGYSSSSNYQKAINICQNIPSYAVTGEGKQIEHKVTLPVTEIELLINLYELVGSWKTSQMLLDGHSATKKQLTYYGLGCFRNRQKAYKPEQYCYGEREYEANIWGCKRLGMPINEWGGGWLDYGHLDKSGVWHFDKERIRHDLDIAIKDNDLCPVLSRTKIMETLDALPDFIDPRKDKNWEYRTSYEEVRGDFQEVAVGIRPVLKKANVFVVGNFKPAWESENNDSSDISLKSNISSYSVAIPQKNKTVQIIWWVIGILVVLYLLF